MNDQVTIYDDAEFVQDVPALPQSSINGSIRLAINLKDITCMEEMNERRQRRRRQGPRLIERLLDPDRDHPVLRKLLRTITPILIQFLTKQLPTWLADLADADEPPTND